MILMIMRRIFVFFLFLVIAVSCSKTSPVPLTSAQQLEYDINFIDQYLADNHIDAIKLESGVRYVIHEMGTGPAPTKDNCIRFTYSGWGLLNTTTFDDTTAFDSNHTNGIKSPLKGLIGGMQIGLKLMPVGTNATIYIPSGLGYGPNGSRVVLPNECLRFDVQVLQLYQYNALANYCYE
jgi:FKBP-type peptidyl-prolyl cis-trans isomerase FkpA